MNNKYIIKSAFAMGEPHDTYGQSWYATVEDIQYPVMFNLMGDQTVQEGDRIAFEEQTVQTFKTGKNAGKEYRRLKKVKVEEGAPRIVQAPKPASDLEARVKKLEDVVFGNGTNPIKDNIISEIGDDYLTEDDLSMIPF